MVTTVSVVATSMERAKGDTKRSVPPAMRKLTRPSWLPAQVGWTVSDTTKGRVRSPAWTGHRPCRRCPIPSSENGPTETVCLATNKTGSRTYPCTSGGINGQPQTADVGQCHIRNQTSAVEADHDGGLGWTGFFNPIGSFQTGSFTTLVTQTETSAIVGPHQILTRSQTAVGRHLKHSCLCATTWYMLIKTRHAIMADARHMANTGTGSAGLPVERCHRVTYDSGVPSWLRVMPYLSAR